MARLLRINATDHHITFSGSWIRKQNETLACFASCEFFLLFRGTGIRMYGTGMTNYSTLLDGGRLAETVPNFNDLFLNYEGMSDGDHQFSARLFQQFGDFFILQHFEIENSSGNGFDLLSAGPTAQNVPAPAVTVDNIDPAITYHNQSQWSFPDDAIDYYGGSASFTSTPGASLSLTFDGVAIWYYGPLCASCGSFNVSIDGSTPQRLNVNSPVKLSQQMIWSNTSLDPGRHTVTLTHDDTSSFFLHLDFFRYRALPGAGTSPLLSAFSTTTLGDLPTIVSPAPPTNQIQTNRAPLVAGLTLGLLALTVVVLCGVRHIYLRRGRRPIGANTVSPFTGPPIGRSDQQPSIPPVLKGVLQPARPPGAPMTTVDPSTSSSETGLGPPPSYETPSYDWRVDTAQ